MTDESTNKVEIRQMDIDDLASVYHLGEDLFTSEELPLLYRTWEPYEVTSYFGNNPNYCLVAESDNKIVGFVLGTTIEKEGTAWKKYGYLSWIGVAIDFQRTHLGQRLYRRVETLLKGEGSRMMIADTQGDNHHAKAFLEAMGFSVASKHLWLTKTLGKGRKKNLDKKVKGNRA
ncbi:MAG: GNAT family N-acetyltransferase [Chloroflexi bacterium]|nr:GNAT family N-acetyltransferase [Chloroflexota bacterium]